MSAKVRLNFKLNCCRKYMSCVWLMTSTNLKLWNKSLKYLCFSCCFPVGPLKFFCSRLIMKMVVNWSRSHKIGHASWWYMLNNVMWGLIDQRWTWFQWVRDIYEYLPIASGAIWSTIWLYSIRVPAICKVNENLLYYHNVLKLLKFYKYIWYLQRHIVKTSIIRYLTKACFTGVCSSIA